MLSLCLKRRIKSTIDVYMDSWFVPDNDTREYVLAFASLAYSGFSKPPPCTPKGSCQIRIMCSTWGPIGKTFR